MRLLVKGDLSSQVTRGHFVKAGFEYIRNSIEQQDVVYNTTRERNIRLLGTGDPIVGMAPFHPSDVRGLCPRQNGVRGPDRKFGRAL